MEPKSYRDIGKRFGNLVVLSIRYVDGKPLATCICDCGSKCEKNLYYLRYGETSSCGCKQQQSRTKHGGASYPEYKVWTAMKQRCHNPRDKAYPNYGGRGIYVCRRWRESYCNFIQDMGRRPSRKHTVERSDNNKGYNPSNCYWATWREQERNTRRSVKVTFLGITRTVSHWAEFLGMSERALRYRLRAGWSVGKALNYGRKME